MLAGEVRTMSLYNPNIGYFYISSILDKDTCAVCKKLNGLTILNDVSMSETIKTYEHGIKDCTSVRGCKCILVGVYNDDAGSSVVVEELKKAGGIFPNKYFKEKDRKLFENAKKQHESDNLSWEVFDYGRSLEKNNLDKSIKIYEDVIINSRYKGSAYLLDVYIRLSICYEREKRYADCLNTIREAYIENNMRMLHRLTNTDIKALLKRFGRCKKQLPQYSKVLPTLFSFNKWFSILYNWGFSSSDWEKIFSDFTEQFGKRPLLNDVAWVLFNKAILSNRNLGSLYNHMADFLDEERKLGSDKLRVLAGKY